jgi:hypothetical protein
MRFKHAAIIVAGVLSVPIYSAGASLGNGELRTSKAESSAGVEYAGRLTHTHHHCHIVITWGHAKRRCHTHRHNKIAHHGPLHH